MQIPARRWLGLDSHPLPARQAQRSHRLASRGRLGTPSPIHANGTTMTAMARPQRCPRSPRFARPAADARAARAPTAHPYTGSADRKAPGGMAAIYRDLAADEDRTHQITTDVAAALARRPATASYSPSGSRTCRNSPTPWGMGYDPVVLRGGMSAKNRSTALARLQPHTRQPVPARGGHRAIRRGRLRLASPRHPVPRRSNQMERTARPVRRAHSAPPPGKATAEIHDYVDERTRVLASSLAKRAPGYVSLGLSRSAAAALHAQRQGGEHGVI